MSPPALPPFATASAGAHRRLRFVRHGATAADVAGLCCGGDLDLPLTDLGRAQAAELAVQLAPLAGRIDVLVCADRHRDRETAQVIAAALSAGGRRPVDCVAEPALRARALGAWNLLPEARVRSWLQSGGRPPGGESDTAFAQRITEALDALTPLWPRRPLLVGATAVARLLGRLAGPGQVHGGHGACAEFDFGPPPAPWAQARRGMTDRAPSPG